MIARVAPLTSTRRLTGLFDYALPTEPIEVGSVVRIPFGRQTLTGVVVAFAQESEVAAEKLVTPLAVLPDSIPGELVELALWIAAEYCSTPARALGLVMAPRGRPKTELWASRSVDADELDAVRLTERQRALLAALPRATGSDLAALRRLEARGLVTIARRQRRRAPRADARADANVVLSDEQSAAVQALMGGGEHLLFGITGSGKTEVYLRAAAAALDRGQGMIVLVPEIGLTSQTVGRFRARFGDTVALLHSGLSDGERYDEWRRLRTGEAMIAVGPRSAIFAPVQNLGLIVIDEEHDGSYKHEGDPRYDARLVAHERARRTATGGGSGLLGVAGAGAGVGSGGSDSVGLGCTVAYRRDAVGATVVAGSATPRPEAWHRLARLTLSKRASNRPLPPVEILDMRDAGHPLHPRAYRELSSARKAIMLANRRGWSNFLTCRSCGKAWTCPNCDVSLVLHRDQGAIACHHCGHREPIPTRCNGCGSPSVARYGAGTERLESELAAALDIPVFRLDADSAKAKDAVPELLARFAAAPAGLLLGTQMVAKGHDFPDVTLAIVVDADSTLRFPDFRAEERTFALIAQLAGRAGRGPQGGRVLVQTTAPDAPAIVAAARHDAAGFLAGELERRRALSYPPYSDLIRIVCSTAESGGQQRAAAGEIAAALTAVADASVLGPAPLYRLRGRHRSQIVVKAFDREAAIAAVRAAVAAAVARREHRSVAFSVDVDPA